MEIIMDPEEIYRKSYSIIEEELKDLDNSLEEKELFKRAAHATADIGFGKGLLIHPSAIEAGIKSIQNGGPIVTDVEMVRSGIRRLHFEEYGCVIKCLLYDADVQAKAKKEGITKSAVAIRKAASFMEGGIVAIGNAPTALFELLKLIKEGKARPALVVGIPIGFVGAAESKELLTQGSVPYITNSGKRGGSPVAAAIVNGLGFLAGKR